MRAILKYIPNNIIAIAAVVIIAFSPIQAAEKNKACEYRTFNIKTNNMATGAELLAQLGEVCDFSIIVKDNEAEKILAKNLNGINIKNLSLDEVFQLIIQDNDLFYTYDKNYLKISALNTKSFKVDYISSIREGKAVINASVDATPIEATTTGTKNNTASQSQNTISSNESFDFWKTISAELTSVLNTGGESYKAAAPIINANAGMITVTATKKQLDRVSDYIDLLKDRLHKQVLIDVSIISVALNSNNKTGVDWSKFSLSFNSTSMFNNSTNNLNAYHADPYASVGANAALTGNSNLLNNLTVVNDGIFSVAGLIDFLGSSGDTKVVSSPKVLTMNNQQALITIGDNINYRVKEDTTISTSVTTPTIVTYTNYSIFIGVLLNITPEISEDNEIILRINPSVSDFKYSADDVYSTTIREMAPDTKEKKLSTVVKVKDGSTIILGGLIASKNGKENTSVPLLSSIPILGEAFKHSADTIQTSELVFVITPRIIGPKGTDKATLKDLGYSQRIYE